jgi:hypothetical protein
MVRKKKLILVEPDKKKPIIDVKRNKHIQLTVRPGKRIYKCVGLKERVCLHWSGCFKIGGKYVEAVDPEMLEILKFNEDKDDILFLIPNDNSQTYGMFVDKENFRLLV